MHKKRTARKFKFKVDRGVPIPEKTQRLSTYQLHKLKVGDSFKFPSSRLQSVRVVTAKWRAKHKKHEFTIRRVNHKSYRCWRVK